MERQPKKFNKLKLLEIIGLIDSRYNYNSGRFESSWRLRLKYYAIFLVKATFCVKICMSNFFERTDAVQLFIGSPYNFFSVDIKRFISLAAFIVLFWVICLNVIFNHLNTRQDYHLYRRWMRLTLELPVKPKDCDYKAFGFSKAKNKQFWAAEDEFNYKWNSAMNGLLFVFSFVVAILLFLAPYEGPIDIKYLLLQTIHSVHIHLVFFTFLNSIYSLNLFYNQVLSFFAKKFSYILRRVQHLQPPNQIDQRKLIKLIYQYQVVQFELIEMNAFFSSFVGVGLIGSSGFIVIVSKSIQLNRPNSSLFPLISCFLVL